MLKTCLIIDQKNSEYWKERVSQNGWALEDVPQELKTIELCTIAVSKYGYILQCVPQDLRTPELCKIAVSESGWALQFVPQELKLEITLKVSLERPLIKYLRIKTWFQKEISKKKNRNLIYLYLGTKDPEIKEIFNKILTKG